MIINNYIWNLYKQSNEGIEMIDLFQNTNLSKISDLYKLKKYFINDDWQNFFIQNHYDKYFTEKTDEGQFIDYDTLLLDYLSDFKSVSFDKAFELYEQKMEQGLIISEKENIFWPEKQDYDGYWFENLPNISFALFRINPEIFVPYFFMDRFCIFQKIFETFNISIPEVPKKAKRKERALYYLTICKALQEFRQINNFSYSELCAFLYSFAEKYIESKETTDLPKPTKVWFVGGGKNNNGDFDYLDNANQNSIESWQGSVETRKGDIIVMYCLTPRSYIHSIWRANSDGFNDPFFYFYNTIFISNPIIIVPISQQELKGNEIFSKNPLVRKNMQGINGYGITTDEYSELLRLMEQKGQDINILPKIEIIENIKNVTLEDERDVEIYLVEPFLERLEYQKTDYLRQMPIKMGRGFRYYPDYAFFANNQRGEEKAKMVLETKYSIKNNKDLQDAYYQAKSYAIRLQAKYFILASKEGIWIYFSDKLDFDFKVTNFKNWNEMNNPDTFHSLLKIIGKKVITKT
jgi:hypothetical protein